jgi:DNA-binding GntR family transcriptional regulator
MLPWALESTTSKSHQLHELRTTSLSKLVRDELMAAIMNGSLAPGDRINEPDVAARLLISRVPVREALRELESLGVVVARKHAGVFVRRLEPDEVKDLYQLRGVLDGFAGGQAAKLPKPQLTALVKQLAISVGRMERAMQEQQSQAYYAGNLQFHWDIVAATGNTAVLDTYRGVVQKLHISRLKNLSGKTAMKASIAEHRAIIRTLREGDGPQAEALMSAHVADALLRLQQFQKDAHMVTTR